MYEGKISSNKNMPEMIQKAIKYRCGKSKYVNNVIDRKWEFEYVLPLHRAQQATVSEYIMRPIQIMYQCPLSRRLYEKYFFVCNLFSETYSLQFTATSDFKGLL